MKAKIKWRNLWVPFLLSVCISAPVLAAPVFQDVDQTHWAYSSIAKMAEQGILTGDTENNYHPDQYIDKFETAKILAKVAGYKLIGYTEEEKTYYDRAYEKNRSILNQWNASFDKWNNTADREIAYLLEKEILTVSDLNQFVILDGDNNEKIRALSRGEICEFLVKLMGKNTEALSSNNTFTFADDTNISDRYKPYVYYLYSLDIISGDTDNKFNPNGAVNRASLAVLLDKTLAQMSGGNTGAPTVTEESIDLTSFKKVETILATFDKFYNAESINANAIQVQLDDGTMKIYKLSPHLTITIDGFLKTPEDLKPGMSLIVVINDSEVVDIKAQTVTSGTTTVNPGINLQLSTITGTIDEVSVESATQTVSILVRTKGLRDMIITDSKSFALDDTCTITREGQVISLSEVKEGDMVTAEVSGVKAYSLQLNDKNRTIEGALVGRVYLDGSEIPHFLVEDNLGDIIELTITNDSTFTRQGVYDLSWNDIRTGDSVLVKTEYNTIKNLDATGVSSSVQGYIEEIHITPNVTTLVIKTPNEYQTFELMAGSVDVYTLRLGSYLRLNLDSREIESLYIIENAPAPGVTGYIAKLTDHTIVVTDINDQTAKEIYVNNNTIMIDATTGEKISISQLDQHMKVYIILQAEAENVAVTVTVLSK